MQHREDKGRAAVMRQAAVVEHSRPCGHRRPRGIEDALPQPHLTRAEHGNPVRVRCGSAGKPTVRRAEFRGGNRMPKKRRPAAERQQETGTERPLLQVAFPDNWPDTRPGAWLRKQADLWQVSL
jgi:hypothetical protein